MLLGADAVERLICRRPRLVAASEGLAVPFCAVCQWQEGCVNSVADWLIHRIAVSLRFRLAWTSAQVSLARYSGAGSVYPILPSRCSQVNTTVPLRCASDAWWPTLATAARCSVSVKSRKYPDTGTTNQSLPSVRMWHT